METLITETKERLLKIQLLTVPGYWVPYITIFSFWNPSTRTIDPAGPNALTSVTRPYMVICYPDNQ